MSVHNNEIRCLLQPLEALKAFGVLKTEMEAGKLCALYGPDDAQRNHFYAALAASTGKRTIILTANELQAMHTAEDINVLLPGQAEFLPGRDITFVRSTAASTDLDMRRIEVLGNCVSGAVRVLVMSADAALFRMPDVKQFEANVIELSESAVMEPAELMQRLTGAGYERVHMVESRGQCALRGGILDVYPVGEPTALRIEFFDDEIDSIRSFDILTQRSISGRRKVRIYPAREFTIGIEKGKKAAEKVRAELEKRASDESAADRQTKLEAEYGLDPFENFLKAAEEKEGIKHVSLGNRKDKSFLQVAEALETGRRFDSENSLLPVLLDADATVFDFMPDAQIICDQPERLREKCEDRLHEFVEMVGTALEHGDAIACQTKLLYDYETVLSCLKGRSILIANPFARTSKDFAPQAIFQIEARNSTAYQSDIKELAQDILNWKNEGWLIALAAGGTARGERLQAALKNLEVEAELMPEVPDSLETGKPVILPLTLSHGFLYPELKFVIAAEADIYGVNRKKARPKVKYGEKIDAFTDLKVGDYVVHENNGIGQFMGIVRLPSDGTYRDFLHIRYQGSDKLYVPTDQLDRVQKYIGSEGETPKLNRLSGSEWQKAKAKARSAIKDIAGELVQLYAAREAEPGYAFDPDTPWQREFEDNFPYEETPDQLAAINEIKQDMEKPRAMDRLLCGDVGYGKTEVALRAIFKAVMSGKQAAMLAPTTILVQQHYATMLNRFAGFPVHVEVLSRFKTAAEQKEIIKRLESGDIDVIVGTHRLLAKDVVFKNLGLLVVDEEQRFGVTHKEAIKKMKHNLDVLTLTATPIPRTLHMSMVGIRDMSLLQSPPEERYPVQTFVVEYSDGMARDAIMRELARGGQVYVLYNRVESIYLMYERLTRLVPEARIAVGHGQMRERALEDVMLDFYEGKFDVLLCTTIIEAGLDVQRANTLIVCDADRFGLAQLYQLRGRVGRSNKLAYAYLTVAAGKVLTETAEKRLKAIREFTEFGSGFRVAMRDLEIRGAGNLLGSEQSGFVAAVGYDLYVKMIEDAVRELRGGKQIGDIDTHMEMHVDAYLPSEYVADDLLRLEMYKKIANVRNDESKQDLIDELIDRFGDPEKPVMNLLKIANLKAACESLGIDYVSTQDHEVRMRFYLGADIDLMAVLRAVQPYQEHLKMNGNQPPILIYFDKKANQEQLLSGAEETMRKVADAYIANCDDRKEG